MRKTILAIALLALPSLGAAQNPPLPPGVGSPPVSPPTSLPPLPPAYAVGLPIDPPANASSAAPTAIELNQVPLSQVIDLYYQNNGRDYILSPEVASDLSPTSFRFSGNIDSNFFRLLQLRGYSVSVRGSVDYISKSVTAQPDSKPFIYFTKYRSPTELSTALQPFFTGRFGASSGISGTPLAKGNDAPTNSATSAMSTQNDYLTFYGVQSEIDQVQKLLLTVDVASPSVEIRAVLYEVSVDNNSGSSLSIVGQSLGNSGVGFSLNTGSTAPAGSASIGISAGGFSLVYSSLAKDSRFKVISSPVLRVLSGKSSTLTVGQEVPILGSVSYTEGSSTPVQSVEYQPSGTIFTVTPTIYRSTINLELHQELSEFIETTSSTVPSPTKLTRKIDSSLTLKPGEIVFIGGIDTDKQGSGRSGFWFFKSKTRVNSRSQLVLMLQANPIPAQE